MPTNFTKIGTEPQKETKSYYNDYNISNLYYDREFLLNEDNDNSPDQTNCKCPEITINLNGISTNTLVDTGSSISCISDNWFQVNKNNLGHFEQLPVSNTFITTALNNKSKRISHIVLLKAQIKHIEFDIQCIIVPNLIKDCIMGIDAIRMLKMEINFKINTITIMSKDNRILIMKFDSESNESAGCKIIKYDDNEYRINNNNQTQNHNNNNNSEINDLIKDNDKLNKIEKDLIINLIKQNNIVFSDKPGRCNMYQHHIRVDNPEHYRAQSYPIPINLQDEVERKLNDMLEDNIIEESNSPFVNPIIIVKKKTGDLRICLDMRRINALITPDYECNRSINELLAKATNSNWLTTLDLTSSYWQIELEPQSRQYTAFQFRGKVYQYVVTPFGLSTSQAALVRALDQVFKNTIENFSLVYIDDICVISPDFNSHLQHLEYVFRKLADAKMTIKLSKSIFCRDRVPFLGYYLTTTGLEPDSEKIKCFQDFPSPTTRKELKRFLGGINYYNKFVDKYAKTVQPLMRLTSKKVKFIWTSNEEKHFLEIKNLFLKTNVLNHPMPNQPYYLQTDSSDFAIGGHLFQIDSQNNKRAILFISKTLKKCEIRYTTTEKELLAVVYCIQKVRHYILNAKLTIITDHKALTFLKTCKLLNGRLTRWILALQDHQFEIVHCKGVDNTIADLLSRVRTDENQQNSLTTTPELIVANLEREHNLELLENLRNLIQLQQNDPTLKQIYLQIKNSNTTEHNRFRINDDILYQKHHNNWLITIPQSLVNTLISECHKFYLHCGARKCLQILQKDFIFKDMARKIRQLIGTCDTCQKCKHSNHPLYGETSGVKSEGKGDLIAIDLIGPLPKSRGGVQYIFIILDTFTKFVQLYNLKRATSQAVIDRMFKEYIPTYGKPKKILTDHGTQFKSRIWIQKLEENQIRHILNPVYHPISNMAERPIKEVKRCLRTYCAQNHRSWSNYISTINSFLNEIQHETTGFTPNELQLNKCDIRFWEEVIQNPFKMQIPIQQKLELTKSRIKTTQAKRAEKLNAKHKITILKENDLVLVKSFPQSSMGYGETAKLFTIYVGPLKILKKMGKAIYSLIDDNGKTYGPYHISLLRRYKIALPVQTSDEPT